MSVGFRKGAGVVLFLVGLVVAVVLSDVDSTLVVLRMISLG